MPTSTDSRKAAEGRVQDLKVILESQPPGATRDALLEECASLVIAIKAFHMEAIRFRMFNVDRLLARGNMAVPADGLAAFAEARQHLEAAGFHTRSHQAPG